MATPAPTPRPAVAALPVYRAGRAATDPTLKLSSNELPVAPLPGVLERVTAELATLHRYPDAGATRLVEAIAAHHGLTPDRVAVGTGSVALLYALMAAYAGPGDEVVYAWRSFEAYPIAVGSSGATGVPVPLTADGRHDLAAMTAALTDRTRVVLLCSPNNPTGPALLATEVEQFLAAVPAGTLVVLDEAYAEFVTDPAAVRGDDLLQRPDVAVLRTFSKAHGLAGLRVGYLLANPVVAGAARAVSPGFGVTAPAQAAAVASLAATDALAERVATVIADRDRVRDGLRTQGWDIPEPQGNFVWLPLGDDAAEFAESVEPIAVRAFPGDGVRVSIGTAEANDSFLAAARRWKIGN